MALGRRKPVQQPLFVTTAALNVRANPFYQAVNKVLDAHHFGTFAEGLCARFYDDGERGGRPPGDLLPLPDGRLLRGDRLQARHRLAV